MTIALTAAGLLVALLIVDGIRKDQRIAALEASYRLERAATDAAHRGQVTELVAAIANERDARREEVADLCQRLQAPDRAVVQHEIKQATIEPPPQPPATDAEYWELSEEHAAAIAEIEARENAPFERA